jgi:uncharacterized membrane protein YqiK
MDPEYYKKRKELALAEIDKDMEEDAKAEAREAKEEADRKREASDRSAERNNSVCDNISNLASAMSSLDGIDPTISEYDAKDLAEMKQQLVASMKYYLGKLPG